MKKLLVILTSCLALAFTLGGDTPMDKLFKAQAKLFKSEKIGFTYTIVTNCQNESGNLEKNQVTGKYVKKGKDFFISNGAIKTIARDGYLININTEAKFISVQYNTQTSDLTGLLNFLNQDTAHFQAEFIKNGGVRLTPKGKGEKKYFYMNYSDFSFTPAGFLKTIYLSFNKESVKELGQPCSWMQVKYTGISTTEVQTSLIDYSKYIQIKGKQVKLQPAYRSYQLNSSLNIESP